MPSGAGSDGRLINYLLIAGRMLQTVRNSSAENLFRRKRAVKDACR